MRTIVGWRLNKPMTKASGPQKGGTKSALTKAKMSASKKALAVTNNEVVGEAVANAMAKDAKGKFLAKLTEENAAWALEQLAAGDTMRNVCAKLNISRTALLNRAARDTEFERDLRLAMEIGAFNLIETAMEAVWGGEASTGSIERDKLVAQFAQWYAARINRKQFGDRAMIEANNIAIHLNQGDTQW